MENFRVRGDPCPEPGPRNRVVQLGAGEFVSAICLSDEPWGKVTHWNDGAGKRGRSEPCTGNTDTCPGCVKKMPKRWKGWLCVMDIATHKVYFLELTPGSYKEILNQLNQGELMRGLRIQARRGERGNKTRLRITVDPYPFEVDLPADQDPAPVLKTLWEWGR